MRTNTFYWSKAGQQDNSNYRSYVKNKNIWLDWLKKKINPEKSCFEDVDVGRMVPPVLNTLLGSLRLRCSVNPVICLLWIVTSGHI